MMGRRVFVGILFGLFLSIASGEPVEWNELDDVSELKKLFVDHSDLVDPFSIQFRHTYLKKTEKVDGTVIRIWCGEVNAKNQMGAYTGWSPFYAIVGLQEDPTVDVATGVTEGMTQVMIDLFCKDLP